MSIPASSLCRTLLLGLVPAGVACGAASAAGASDGAPQSMLARFAAAPVPPDSSSPIGLVRRADAVVLDPWPTPSPPVARAGAGGIATLRVPETTDAVAALVEAFVDAWKQQSLDGLLALTATDAGLLDGPDHGHGALVDSWRQRLRAHDYGCFEGAEIVRSERIQRWEFDELGRFQRPARPASMQPGDVLVRVPIEVTRIGGEGVFGDVVLMVLRRQAGGLRIRAYGEIDEP